MKRLDRVVKRPRSSSTGSALVLPPGPSVSQDAPPRRTRQLEMRERSHSLTMRGAPVSPTDSPIGRPVTWANGHYIQYKEHKGGYLISHQV